MMIADGNDGQVDSTFHSLEDLVEYSSRKKDYSCTLSFSNAKYAGNVSLALHNLHNTKDTFPLSSPAAQRAWKDLENLGYDIDALMRRNMNDEQIVELRDKAFRYRGIQTQ